MPAVTELPTPPNRNDEPALFNSRAQAMIDALVDMVPEINALFGSGGLDQIAVLATTSWGRNLLTLADAAAARSYMGVSGLTGTWRTLSALATGWTHTGNTAETTVLTLANLLSSSDVGPNGIVKITTLWSCTANDASVKTGRVKIGGTTIQAPALASNRGSQRQVLLRNRGSLSSQIAQGATQASDYTASTVVPAAYAIDFATAKDVTFTIHNAANGDSTKLESYHIEAMYLP